MQRSLVSCVWPVVQKRYTEMGIIVCHCISRQLRFQFPQRAPHSSHKLRRRARAPSDGSSSGDAADAVQDTRARRGPPWLRKGFLVGRVLRGLWRRLCRLKDFQEFSGTLLRNLCSDHLVPKILQITNFRVPIRVPKVIHTAIFILP